MQKGSAVNYLHASKVRCSLHRHYSISLELVILTSANRQTYKQSDVVVVNQRSCCFRPCFQGWTKGLSDRLCVFFDMTILLPKNQQKRHLSDYYVYVSEPLVQNHMSSTSATVSLQMKTCIPKPNDTAQGLRCT